MLPVGDCKLTQTNQYYIREIYLTKLNKIIFNTARFSGYKFTRFSNSFASNRFTTGACRIGLPDSSLSGLLEVPLIVGV